MSKMENWANSPRPDALSRDANMEVLCARASGQSSVSSQTFRVQDLQASQVQVMAGCSSTDAAQTADCAGACLVDHRQGPFLGPRGSCKQS